MNVSVFGLGYVGCVTAGCLAARGHRVIGVDVSADKVAMVNAGTSPIIEPGLGELLTQVVGAGSVVGHDVGRRGDCVNRSRADLRRHTRQQERAAKSRGADACSG